MISKVSLTVGQNNFGNFTKSFSGEDGEKNLGADANGDATGESKDESGENGAKTVKPGDGEGELTKNVFLCIIRFFF